MELKDIKLSNQVVRLQSARETHMPTTQDFELGAQSVRVLWSLLI